MRIELSEEDYRFLVDLAYLGEWMINAYRDPMRTLPEYEDALRQLLVFCEEAGFPELADEETHDPTSVLENDREVRRFIEGYNDENFWHELLERLAYRDLEKKMGFRTVRDLPPEERDRLLEEIEDKYLEELEKNGIDNLEFKGTP
ncbi:MAG: hypothetical protein AUJ52_01900 [Elusimicrobia bacterium CG1_02_63_36]|nr:MAG: hypothetical protein AUJ52_01900 [Elusimicrobia bacterium CG1_02_63_36]PIP82463.1 MAG: hypothetical protein COR54_14705 [Elusimicrobia bacterium CG22_combo_CG10-13_8_21_14_all_63_91]PJA16355.1 MAG: hypothetical protein COX66_07765 [Elusimicrobia bacterium CG_4_10_14_0_2_um_filter_63_34]PJB26892.1 MAG: hypothetical protein CO113_01220 [Elusimicrobia bacterium CG_4_9_14_3_um_filter_62_55]